MRCLCRGRALYVEEGLLPGFGKAGLGHVHAVFWYQFGVCERKQKKGKAIVQVRPTFGPALG